jgi:hypothetical protein
MGDGPVGALGGGLEEIKLMFAMFVTVVAAKVVASRSIRKFENSVF